MLARIQLIWPNIAPVNACDKFALTVQQCAVKTRVVFVGEWYSRVGVIVTLFVAFLHIYSETFCVQNVVRSLKTGQTRMGRVGNLDCFRVSDALGFVLIPS